MKMLINHWLKVGLLGIVIVFFSVSIAQAMFTVKEYKAMKGQDKEAFMLYILGVGGGLAWANAFLKTNGASPIYSIYCQPPRLVLGADNYFRILDDEIERVRKKNGFQETQDCPIEPLLLYGLMNTFPCNNK